MRLAHELDVLTAICTQIKNGEGGGGWGGWGGKVVTKAGMPDFDCSLGFRDRNCELGSVKLKTYKNAFKTPAWRCLLLEARFLPV